MSICGKPDKVKEPTKNNMLRENMRHIHTKQTSLGVSAKPALGVHALCETALALVTSDSRPTYVGT